MSLVRVDPDLSVLLTQVSTKFPKSKIVNFTVLARGDIPSHTLTKRNDQVIALCSSLPTVHLITLDNLFSKGPDLMHDTKQIKKQHLGLFAANLVEAIRGRAKNARACQLQTAIHLAVINYAWTAWKIVLLQ